MSQQTSESLLSRLHRTVIMEGASGGLAGGFDDLVGDAQGVDVTGLSGANVGDGSVLHHGPSEGGVALERPSAGYLAHASVDQGVEVAASGERVSQIARDINDAATLEIDGHRIAVLDYLPGGDLVQAAGGQADPGQLMMTIAQHAIMHQEARRSIEGAPTASSGIIDPSGSRADHDANAVQHAQVEADGVGNSRQRPPDADENMRDLEALTLKHRLELDTAVQSSDVAEVSTQIHAHGRTLEITTNFEATKPDNAEEREDASDHIDQVARGVHKETSHDEPGMHMRSRIAAHLDAARRDDGLSM